MNAVELLSTANGNLRSARTRTILTILSILIGAFTLTLSLGASTGLSSWIRSQGTLVRSDGTLAVSRGSEGGGTAGLTVEEYDPDQGLRSFAPLDADDLDAVRAVPGIERVEPLLGVDAEYIEIGGKRLTISLAELQPTMSTTTRAGSLDDVDEPSELALGSGYLSKLDITDPDTVIGDEVSVVVFDQLRTPQTYQFTIAAILPESLLYNATALVTRGRLDEMLQFQAAGVEDLLYRPQVATAYLAEGTDSGSAKAAIREIGLDAKTVEDQADGAAASLRPITVALLGFSMVAILASTFGIVNTLLMSVKERTKEIGLLKALGAPDRQVFGLFAAEAIMLGIWGAGLGMLLGIAVGLGIGALVGDAVGDTLPGFTPFGLGVPVLVGAPIVILVIAFVAGALPARRAMKLDPIQALRHD